MRQIKFRKYDKTNKVWEIYDLHRIGYEGEYHWDDESIGQFTGLLDKNGKEIYEGDIVKLTYPVMPEWSEQTKLVEWWDNKAGFSIEVGDAREVKEIIGNIYQNKELIP